MTTARWQPDVVATLAFIGLGSNLDHPRRRISKSVASLARLPRTRVLRVSPNYVSAPLGVPGPQPDYVNAVALVSTRLAPRVLLNALLAIERRQHRRREQGRRNAPRTLDLDLLLYGRRRIRVAHLTVPHPRMHERAFVLRPLADIAPAIKIPGRGAVKTLLASVSGQRIQRTRSHRRR